MQTAPDWLILTGWIALAALFCIAVWGTPYNPVIFVVSMSAALYAHTRLYRQRGGRWQPLIVGTILLVLGILNVAMWVKAHPF